MKLSARQFAIGAGTLAFATVVACAGNAEGSTPSTISPDIYAPIPTPRPFGLKPTPTSTPFVVPVPTVTAFPTVADAATAVPTATASPTIGAPGPEPTAAPTATPEPTVQPTTSPDPTATPLPDTTATPESTATPGPAATPTPEPSAVAPGGLAFLLEESVIPLDPNNASPEFISSGTDIANFSVAATFDNPINGTFRDFSYGVKFREIDGLYHAISINSAGDVRYLEGVRGEDEQPDSFTVVQDFNYNDVATNGSGSNSIHLTVIEDGAWLFVNNDYFVHFTVGGVGVSGDVQFISELENETQISGAFTQITNLQVRNGESAASMPSLIMVKEASEITRTELTGSTGTFLVEALFVSGYERVLGKWSVGFEFTDPISGTSDWVLINNSKQWQHFRQVSLGGQIEEISGGIHNGILVDRGDVNQMQILGQNGEQQLFINGTLVSSVSIQPELLPVQISAFSGFADSDQQPGFPTQMLDYVAWSFGI